MDEAAIAGHIREKFSNVQESENFGYQFFFYGDDHRLPFATIACTDNEYETISNLSRPGVFRLNIGVSRESFQSLFGSGEVAGEGYDFTELDRIMPHPDYARQFFVCVLNPGDATLSKVLTLLAEAHAIAEHRYLKRVRNGQAEDGDVSADGEGDDVAL